MLILSWIVYVAVCAVMATSAASMTLFDKSVESPIVRVIVMIVAYPIIAFVLMVIGYALYLAGWFMTMPFRALLGL